MREVLIVATGGAFGAAARYLVSGWTYGWLGERFPWGTLAVNLLGCFGLGVIMRGLETNAVSADARLLVGIGFLGAFTTFSTFGYETLRADMGVAILNVMVSVVCGLGAVYVGLVTARAIWGRGA
ncbi:MAG: fluoride efflux transporter CrcB [Planctomycetota bacterium]